MVVGDFVEEEVWAPGNVAKSSILPEKGRLVRKQTGIQEGRWELAS